MRVSSGKGHILVLLPLKPSQESIQRIRDTYPDVAVSVHSVPWGSTTVPEDVTAEELADVTILLGLTAFPSREAAPNLELVQLSSAGANHVLEHPLFKDTDVKFCTANGVHGWASFPASP